MVSDREIISSYKLLAQKEGIFVEPASAASVAGLLKLAKKGYFLKRTKEQKNKRTRIVCILTGHGLKDPDRAIKSIKKPKIVEASLKAVVKALRLEDGIKK
jgi:threonine synthase